MILSAEQPLDVEHARIVGRDKLREVSPAGCVLSADEIGYHGLRWFSRTVHDPRGFVHPCLLNGHFDNSIVFCMSYSTLLAQSVFTTPLKEIELNFSHSVASTFRRPERSISRNPKRTKTWDLGNRFHRCGPCVVVRLFLRPVLLDQDTSSLKCIVNSSVRPLVRRRCKSRLVEPVG